LLRGENFLRRSRRRVDDHEIPSLMTSFDSFPRVSKDSPFQVPEKKINSDFDVTRFNVSTAFDRIVGFILLLNESIKGKSCLDEDIIVNDTIKAIGEVLDTLNGYIDEIPPSTGPRRFGNVAFRDWIRRMEEVCVSQRVEG
jgi:serine/threonine-protein phosphatase 2A activator